MISLQVSFLGILLCSNVFAADHKVQKFLFIGRSAPQAFSHKINDKVEGVQVIYSWKSIEKDKDKYDFEKIETDLAFLKSRGKKLWIQLQDRFFDAKDRSIPDYLLNDPIYQGGLARQRDNPGEGQGVGSGWVSKQWNPALSERYQKLIAQIALKLDGRIYGINLPETSADIDFKAESKMGFTCDRYFESTLKNINFAKKVFKKSYVVQYTNFWPCEWENDHKYMSRFFENAVINGIGLGGPDIIPYRKGQMKNSYPFFNKYKRKLPIVAFAVQEPTRTYTNPKTGKKFTDEEFLDFGENFLGVNLIFWSTEINPIDN